MIYTAYTKDEYEALTKLYKSQVVGISDCGEVMQVPLCPECGSEMMEIDTEYLSCITCGCTRHKRILKG